MVEKKQLNVRIPVELQERIENDDRSKVDIVVEALELYFGSKKHLDASKNDTSGNSNASKNDSLISKFEPIDSDGIARMKNEIEYLRSKVDDMIKLLHQEQVLHIQTQHMLTATPQVMKKWWQFWR